MIFPFIVYVYTISGERTSYKNVQKDATENVLHAWFIACSGNFAPRIASSHIQTAQYCLFLSGPHPQTKVRPPINCDHCDCRLFLYRAAFQSIATKKAAWDTMSAWEAASWITGLVYRSYQNTGLDQMTRSSMQRLKPKPKLNNNVKVKYCINGGFDPLNSTDKESVSAFHRYRERTVRFRRQLVSATVSSVPFLPSIRLSERRSPAKLPASH